MIDYGSVIISDLVGEHDSSGQRRSVFILHAYEFAAVESQRDCVCLYA